MKSEIELKLNGIKFEVERTFDGSLAIFAVESIKGSHIDTPNKKKVNMEPMNEGVYAILVKRAA